jgi:hypothetical protein
MSSFFSGSVNFLTIGSFLFAVMPLIFYVGVDDLMITGGLFSPLFLSSSSVELYLDPYLPLIEAVGLYNLDDAVCFISLTDFGGDFESLKLIYLIVSSLISVFDSSLIMLILLVLYTLIFLLYLCFIDAILFADSTDPSLPYFPLDFPLSFNLL